MSTTSESNETRVAISDVKLFAEYLQCFGTVNNRTGQTLVLEQIQPDMWGKWITSPKGRIEPNGLIQFEAWGRENSPSGTSAWVLYAVEGTDTKIRLYFSVPYIGKNEFWIKCEPEGRIPVKETNNGNVNRVRVIYTIG